MSLKHQKKPASQRKNLPDKSRLTVLRAFTPRYPTVNPLAALAGAILHWGGSRGSAVAVLIQAPGIWGCSDPIIHKAGAGSSSQQHLKEGRARGWIEVDEEIYKKLLQR